MRIDGCAVALRFPDGWPRDQPAQIAPVHVARSVVVGIEKVSVLWNFCAIFRDESFQDKSFEKPRGMCEMPFGWTDVRHGLHDTIFGFETSTQRVSEFSDLMKAIAQRFDPGMARWEKRLFCRRRFGGGFK